MSRYAFLTFLLTSPAWAQQAEEDIRGAKPLIEVAAPQPKSAWPMMALIAFIALLVIAGIWWWLKRRSRHLQTAEEKARQELGDLKQNGGGMSPGDFALAASQVVRVFVERKFGLAAPKRTTEEFLTELATAKNESLVSRMEPLRGFLRSCDMAKFAGTKLESEERDHLISLATAFVDAPDVPESKEVTP